MTLFRKSTSVALVSVVAGCLAASASLAAAPIVTYTASGTFSSPPISGNDLFQLQGEPFSITVLANEALVPKDRGAQWALFSSLKMAGTVQSALLPTPISISNHTTAIVLATGNPNQDVFRLNSPVMVLGITVTVTANIIMPKGTLTNDHILPFTTSVRLTPANATMTYSTTTDTTTLGVNGILTAAVPGNTTDALVMLHSDGAEAITMHADGTRSVRPIRTGTVDLGAASDTVALQFYATGVRDKGDLRVQIGGEEVAVLYAGAADRFPGLDLVSVRVPRSLAGRGDADVLLTTGGQTSSPVRVRIQ